jgi:cytochrome c oxidase cbb3-type subunit III
MRVKKSWIGACLLLSAVAFAQRGGPGPGGRGNAGQQARPAPTNFPAQQRPPGDPALVTRGNTLYGINCRSCHGADLRGGEQGGPNLLRSALVLNDKSGESIFPVVRDGIRTPGMPGMAAIPLSEGDVKAIAEYIHSVLATAQRQGGPPPGPPVALNLLVGDPNAGKAYFDAKCASCHSVTGDLKGFGSRTTNIMQLQNSWLAGNPGGGRGGGNPSTVTVTLQSGEKIQGQLNRVDDFLVILTTSDGASRSFRRNGDSPKVEIRDPRDPHRQLLPQYTDKDIHNVTAYLVTLK